MAQFNLQKTVADMEFDHQTLVAVSKSYGLFYLIAMSVIVLIYALWPRNKERFERAARSIIDDKDTPCL